MRPPQHARDMAYKRTAMLELARERPVLLSVDEFDHLNRQIHRYAALVEDVEEYAEHCQFCSKSCGLRSRKKPTKTFTSSQCSR
jgi:nicotinic acid mononucleotide adenylyltransferase